MERNIPLLRQVYRQIKDNPETHNQKMWVKRSDACGTTGCVAGWAVMLGDPAAHPIWESSRSGGDKAWYLSLGSGENTVRRDYGNYGAELLGLAPTERWWLFHEDRTHAEVLGALADLITGESTEYMREDYDPDDYDWDEALTEDIDGPEREPLDEGVELAPGVTVHTYLIDELDEDPYGPSLDADWGVPELEFQQLHAM